MGFDLKWRSWIRECISTAKMPVLINGSPTSEFHMLRGLKQGDPLSPFLFVLVTEALHQIFLLVENFHLIEGIPFLLPDESISHLQFADDTILFLKAKEDCVSNVLQVLKCFELWSGLRINFRNLVWWGSEWRRRNLIRWLIFAAAL
ncbi:hypothetical protein GQ457_06G014410 [Hibiscus cannabinus]